MPPKKGKSIVAAPATHPTSRMTRRSVDVKELLALDLYAKAGRCSDIAVTSYKPNENHNGVVAESTVTVAASKRRAQNTARVRSGKRQKRSDSSSGTTSDSESTRDSSPPAPKRAPAAAKGKGKGKGPTAAEAARERRAQVAARKLLAGGNKKEPETDENGEGEGEEEKKLDPVTPPVHSPKRGRSVAARSGAQSPAPMRAVSRDRFAFVPSDDGQDETQSQKVDLRPVLTSLIEEQNPHMSATRKTQLVGLLDSFAYSATTMAGVDYENVVHNIKSAEQCITDGERALDGAATKDKIATLEAEVNVHRYEAARVKDELTDLNRMLALTKAEVESSASMAEQLAADNLAKQVKEAEVYADLAKQLKENEDSLALLKKQSSAHRVPSTTSSGSSSAEAAAAASGPGPSSSVFHNHMIMPHTHAYVTPPEQHQRQLPGVQRPFAHAYVTPPAQHQRQLPGVPLPFANMPILQQLPRGSAIGHSHMAGRADEMIQGLHNVTGIRNTSASVSVTAATMSEVDEDGNSVQRTIRTRVERVFVTEDMDVDELRRQGFHVVHVAGSDAEDDNEEHDVNGHVPARIEEVGGGGDEEMGGDVGDGPFVEEAE